MRVFFLAILWVVVIGSSQQAKALDADIEAKRLLERLSGTKVPGDHPLLPKIKNFIAKGLWYEAAEAAMEHPGFLNVTVKQMALKMSTRDESFQIEFNDFAAGFMGVVRDNRDARELLTGNFQYIGDMKKAPEGVNIRSEYAAHIVRSNDHYRDLDNLKVDIASLLMPLNGQMLYQSRTDSLVYNPDPAGLLTSRAFLGAHTTAGTNRRPVEFTFREFMCIPIEGWADTAVSDSRIGRDIDRYPGGDHTRFQVSCKGCHTVMDGFRGSFAKWNFSNDYLVNRDVQVKSDGTVEGGVEGKLNQNSSVFPAGFVTTNNSFVNNARGPANESRFGWRGDADEGYGVKDFGRIVAHSSRFSQCMVKRVFEAVCRKEILFDRQMHFLKYYAESFEQKGYNLRTLFRLVSVTEECVR